MMAGKWYNSLRVQIVVLLSLALFPLGAIAIYQTNRVEAGAERNRDLALLALTKRAAGTDETIIKGAIGAAQFLSSVAEDYIKEPQRCGDDLAAFLAENDAYNAIRILSAAGDVRCSSERIPYDLSSFPDFERILSNQEQAIAFTQLNAQSGQRVFIVSEPYEIAGVFAGFISIWIPRERLLDTAEDLTELGLINLLTLDETSDVLASSTRQSALALELPVSLTLQNLLQLSGRAVHAKKPSRRVARLYCCSHRKQHYQNHRDMEQKPRT